MKLWDVSDPLHPRVLHTLAGHEGSVFGAAFSGDGALLATCGSDRTVRVWDVATGALLRTLRRHAQWVWCVAFHPLHRTLLMSADRDGCTLLWTLDA